MRRLRDASLALAVIVLVMTVVGFRGFVTAPSAFAADPTVDIAAQLVGKSSEYKGKPFTYDLTVSNVGATDASGSTFTFIAGSGSTGVKIVCSSATSGAVCPTNLAVSGLNATGTVGTFPAGGQIHLTVTGYYGYGSSATATLSVNPPSGSTDTNPASNNVSQQTALSGDAIVSVTKTQDKASVASGEARTYTVTYRNDGPADMNGVMLNDVYVRAMGSTSTSLDSFLCSATGGAVCPTLSSSLPYRAVSGNYFYPHYAFGPSSGLTVNLPAGSSLTFTMAITEIIPCTTQTTLDTLNQVSMQNFPSGLTVRNSSGTVVTSTETATVTGTFTGVPSCPVATVAVSKTQDKLSVASGEARKYTVTYRNDGPTDLRGVYVDDVYSRATGSTSISLDSISCLATGAAVCPTLTRSLPYTNTTGSYFYPYYAYSPFNRITVDLPAGSSLTFTMTITEVVQCSVQPTLNVANHASLYNFSNNVTVKNLSGTVVTNDVAIVTGTISGLPACPTATVSVLKTQDKATITSGEARKYTITYRNDGPTDLRGVKLGDFYVRGTGSASISLDSISCSANGAAVCPNVIRPLPYTSTTGLYFYPYYVYDPSNAVTVDLPAGSSLQFTVVITENLACSTQASVNVVNQASLYNFPYGVTVKNAGGNVTNNEVATVSGTIDTSKIVDVSTITAISNPNPKPLGALTTTSTISNSCHTATNVPVTVKLPENGFLAPQPATPTCTASGGATCPADLRFDAATNSILGTVGSIPAGGNVVLSLLGTAGVIPPTTASYKITSTAPAANDTIPTVGTLNESNATFAYSNVQSPVTAKVTVSGGPAGGWSGSMAGTLVCQNQGSFPFTLSVVNGVSAVTSVVAALWEHDTCTATLTRPDPPAGYSWGDWTAGPSFTRTDIVGAQQFDFATSLVSDTVPYIPQLPFTGGRSAVSFTITGLSLLGLSLIFIVWRRRKVIS
ncbi:LPXTG cell wall anchor domain-containing protein [Arcanobacterium bovis]|uniref:DUF11 domain-containing protein n=1 Tax=Arcanobacterium bovis TaxID=2529275 RepID=A0A4Q9V2A4_9ACTO|nr:LPXTG cell wall anchor domain-containing protein [Arcanobacterium bovis]TBW23740.1 DUF11 domain-containing protein [Arcanobacterium bovis]